MKNDEHGEPGPKVTKKCNEIQGPSVLTQGDISAPGADATPIDVVSLLQPAIICCAALPNNVCRGTYGFHNSWDLANNSSNGNVVVTETTPPLSDNNTGRFNISTECSVLSH